MRLRENVVRSWLTLALLSAALTGLPQGSGRSAPAGQPPAGGVVLPAEVAQRLGRLSEEGSQAFGAGDHARAEKSWAAGLQEARRAGSPFWTELLAGSVGMARQFLGNAARSQGRMREAKEWFARAVTAQELAPHGGTGSLVLTLQELGRTCLMLSEHAEARAAFLRALQLLGPNGDLDQRGNCLRLLGISAQQLGRLAEARRHFLEARAVWESQPRPDRRALATLTVNLATLALAEGDRYQALELFSDVLQDPSETPILVRAACFTNLGVLYQSLRDFDLAQSHYEEACRIYEDLNRRLGKEVGAVIAESLPAAYHNLGSLFADKGDFKAASRRLHQSLDLYQKAENREGMAAAYLVLGFAHLQNAQRLLGQRVAADRLRAGDLLKQSVTSLDRALPLYQKSGNWKNLAVCYQNRGAAHFWLGKYPESLRFHTLALQLSREHLDSTGIAAGEGNVGEVHERLGNRKVAERHYAAALRQYGKLDARLFAPRQVGLSQEGGGSRYFLGRYARLLARLGRSGEALARLEQGRDKGLTFQAAWNRIDILHTLAPPEGEQLQQARVALAAAGQELYAAEAPPRPPDNDRAARQRYDQALLEARQRSRQVTGRYNQLLDRLATRRPEFGQALGQLPRPAATLTDLGRRDPRALFMEWVTVDERETLLLAFGGKDRLKSYFIPTGRWELERLVGEWRELLQLPGLAPAERRPELRNLTEVAAKGREREAAVRLGRALLTPLAKDGWLKPHRYTRLVVVGDGPLLELPWGALVTPGGQRLVEQYPIATASSLGSLLARPGRRQPTSSVLVAANPAGPPATQMARRGPPTPRRGGLGPLQFAPQEGAQVAALFRDAALLMGPQAREADVKREMQSRGLLLFATHGLLDPGDGLRSWLLLAAEPRGSGEDGRLEAREVAELPLAAELAILSACQTGLGQRGGGEGLLGLAWAFRAAGCPSVVTTLWSVDDAATLPLVREFCRRLLEGERKDTALQEAMRTVRGAGEPKHPYYWAGFQLTGSAEPLSERLRGYRAN